MFGRVCVRGPVLVVVVILYVGEMAGDGREKAYEQTKINLLKPLLKSALETFLGSDSYWGSMFFKLDLKNDSPHFSFCRIQRFARLHSA